MKIRNAFRFDWGDWVAVVGIGVALYFVFGVTIQLLWGVVGLLGGLALIAATRVLGELRRRRRENA